MKNLGYGKGYKYAHDQEDGIADQDHLPPELKNKKYYQPSNHGYEAIIRDRLIKWRRILAHRHASRKKDKS